MKKLEFDLINLLEINIINIDMAITIEQHPNQEIFEHEHVCYLPLGDQCTLYTLEEK